MNQTTTAARPTLPTSRRLEQTMVKTTALITLALLLTACATVHPPVVDGAAGGEVAWARVLDRHVADGGQVDFIRLRQNPRELAAYVAWVATHGPRSTPALFPADQSRLAYYLNAYNAVAMHHVVASTDRPQDRVTFFLRRRFVIDGEPMSLYAFETDVIRPLGDPRVHFALNCMVRSCPRLPRVPFVAEHLDDQLEAEARRFLTDPRNVQLDPPLGTVRLNAILEFYTRDFLARAPSLIAYVNRYRDEKIPDGYRVRFTPYDWTLNQQ